MLGMISAEGAARRICSSAMTAVAVESAEVDSSPTQCPAGVRSAKSKSRTRAYPTAIRSADTIKHQAFSNRRVNRADSEIRLGTQRFFNHGTHERHEKDSIHLS